MKFESTDPSTPRYGTSSLRKLEARELSYGGARALERNPGNRKTIERGRRFQFSGSTLASCKQLAKRGDCRIELRD